MFSKIHLRRSRSRMSSLHFTFLAITVVLRSVCPLKIITLEEPYLSQSPSTAESGKEQDEQELPLYRDLPPFMKAAKDLTEALEATRRLMIVHPPFDDGDFLARLKEAGVEYRAAVIGEPPHLFDTKTGKSGTTTLKENAAQHVPKLKTMSQVFQAHSKSSPNLLQDTSVKSQESPQVDHTENENETLPMTDPTLDISGEDPFKEVQVEKLAIEEGEVTGVPIPDTTESALAPAPSEPEVKVGVKVEAPYTHVQVKRGSNNGYSRQGAEVGVRVEAPFTNVKVKKLADIPADALPGSNGGGGGGGSYPDMGVRVEAPFVRVKVDGPALHHIPGAIDGTMGPARKKHRDNHPRRSGQPLNLDINIPGIFNLKLLRDETGRGRLGIGVLPVFSSLVNPHQASDHYPGPPPPPGY